MMKRTVQVPTVLLVATVLLVPTVLLVATVLLVLTVLVPGGLQILRVLPGQMRKSTGKTSRAITIQTSWAFSKHFHSKNHHFLYCITY